MLLQHQWSTKLHCRIFAYRHCSDLIMWSSAENLLCRIPISELCVMYPEQSLSKIMNEREKADRNVTHYLLEREHIPFTCKSAFSSLLFQ